MDRLRSRQEELENEVDILQGGGSEAALLELEMKRELRRIVQTAKTRHEKRLEEEARQEEARKQLAEAVGAKQQACDEAEAALALAGKALREREEELARAQSARDAAAAHFAECRRRHQTAAAALLQRDHSTVPYAQRALETLIPTVKQLLAPQRDELHMVAATIPEGILKLAEEGAQRERGPTTELGTLYVGGVRGGEGLSLGGGAATLSVRGARRPNSGHHSIAGCVYARAGLL